jgi:DNA anti-recombination protein RmuC
LDISGKSGKCSTSDDGKQLINRQLKQTQEQSEGCERQLENIVRQANQEISKLSAKVQGVVKLIQEWLKIANLKSERLMN